MLKTDQYKTSKHGYVTKTQQQKGLAKFLQNSKLISLVGEDWMRKSATPAGDTYTPLLLRPQRGVHTNPVTFQSPSDCQVSSPTTDHFCCSFLYKMVKTIGFKIQPKHRWQQMHVGKTRLLALKDITDLPGAKDCTHVNSTHLKKNSGFKIYRGSPLGTSHWWRWIMQ